jgi:hypothetical protein
MGRMLIKKIQNPNNLPKQYAFATSALLLRNHLLLNNQSSVHSMCNPDLVNNIWESSQPMILKSNGGSLLISEVADLKDSRGRRGFQGMQ